MLYIYGKSEVWEVMRDISDTGICNICNAGIYIYDTCIYDTANVDA